MSPRPIFFCSPSAFRDWLELHHDRKTELWVGYYKVETGRPSLTWPQSVDEALCFGWIDGIRKSVDSGSYCIRFTPRKPNSRWSEVNTRRFLELKARGLVHPAGEAAFSKRNEQRDRSASAARAAARLSAEFEKRFRRNARAWKFFQTQPPGYRRLAVVWVMDAKREDTRRRRLDTLIEDSAAARRIAPLRRAGPS